jgi:putative glutamine amidotransferase
VTRPLVGITCGSDARRRRRIDLREDYVRSVEQAGAVAAVLPPGRAEDAGAVLDRLDGMVLSGGGDVDPVLYGEAPHPRLGRVERERDEYELALLAEALRRDLPVLAICRGHQVLNVALGGTLLQDIPSVVTGGVDHDPPVRRWRRVHRIEVVPGSRLHEVLERVTVSVNSFHHQAVGQLGRGLVVSARAEDGLIEGLELPDHRFVLGVQWHPESFWNRKDSFQALFDAHASACRAPHAARLSGARR